ncbi:MAG TPA: twin-arginine translocase subunit TatC [Candidatus Omnitrophota bacterium]|jgi:sec-independent protein translocase protein TatC|nr:twin-arginine translocase subunit TatC [Candidatus Omnitrophota bacterium]
MNAETDMPFWEHVEELRRRCVVLLGGWLALSIGCYFCTDWMLETILKPVGEVIFIYPAEAFVARLKLACWAGFVLSVPLIFVHAFWFVQRELQGRARAAVIKWGLFSFVGCVMGIIFGHMLLVPYTIGFLLGFGSEILKPMITVQQYLEFYLSLIAASLFIFELPLAMVMLTYLRVFEPQRLSCYRRHAYVGIFILAAVLSPPDVVTQLILAIPLCGLYEVGLVCAYSVKRHR